MAQPKTAAEAPQHAAHHCLTAMPYRMIVFVRTNGATPLYQVAGSAAGPLGAKKALQAAHALHGGACFYCRKEVEKDKSAIDHVEARARGGRDELQNLVISCKPCNAAKGIRAIEHYKPDAGREWLSAVLAQVQDRLNRL